MTYVENISDKEVQGSAKDLFVGMTEKSGKVPEWMRVMAHCDDTLMAFFSLFKTLMDDSPADPKLKWKIAHHVSELNKCKYCASVSINMLKKFGVPEEDIKNIEEASNEKELLALEFASQMTLTPYDIDKDIRERMKDDFSDAEIVEIASVVGLFNYINRFNDAMQVVEG